MRAVIERYENAAVGQCSNSLQLPFGRTYPSGFGCIISLGVLGVYVNSLRTALFSNAFEKKGIFEVGGPNAHRRGGGGGPKKFID